jgi:hypothetical protein
MRAGVVLMASAALTACAPGLSLRGTVREIPARCVPESGGGDQGLLQEGQPLEGARITIRCPDSPRPLLEAVSDGQGRFAAFGDGLADLGCWVRVDKPGYAAVVYPLSHLCAVEGTVLSGCHAASLQAELHRRSE